MSPHNTTTSPWTARPPVVAVLGHIDHGKTTLLDQIRKSAVAAKEAGGITQHVGAYEITHTLPDGTQKKITFLDTPGHEAFSKMRARGAQVADIAVLVVAADEGVKPQTLEALEHIKASGATLLVAINKIDKPEAKPEKIKQQLAENGVLLEGWGGNVPHQEISAKTGKGIPDLLTLILLAAEVAELKADPALEAQGAVIEAHKDARVGNVTTLLVRDGTLRKGEYVVAGNAQGKIRNITAPDGTDVASATFSSPVVVIGFDTIPAVGETFRAVADKKAADALAAAFLPVHPHTKFGVGVHTAVPAPAQASAENAGGEKPTLHVVLKADAAGTKEALEKMVSDMDFPRACVRVVKSDVGEVNENDVTFAESTHAVVAAFKVKVSQATAKLAQAHGVLVLRSETVYELADELKRKLQELLPPEVQRQELGKLTVLATFKMEKAKMIVGGRVSDGKIKRGAKVDVKRKGTILFSGKIIQLQHQKEDVAEVPQGRECGMMIVPHIPQDKFIEVGDELAAYEEETALRPLE